MKKYEVSERFIREAYGEACAKLKAKIENEFPDLFEVKLEVGKWYKNLTLEGSYMLYSGFTDGRYYNSIGVSSNGIWHDLGCWSIDDGYALATKKEIESMLWKEAEKRGIDKDTKIVSHADNNVPCNDSDGGYSIGYYHESDRLWNSRGCIYHKGKWAAPLKENNSLQQEIDSIQKQLDELKAKIG